MVVVLSVCKPVTMLAATHLEGLYVKNKVIKGSLWHFQYLYHLALVENASFKSSGVSCKLLLAPHPAFDGQKTATASFQQACLMIAPIHD